MLGVMSALEVSPPLEGDQIEIQCHLSFILPIGTRLMVAQELRKRLESKEEENLFSSPDGFVQFLSSVVHGDDAMAYLIKRLLSYEPGDDGLDQVLPEVEEPPNEWWL